MKKVLSLDIKYAAGQVFYFASFAAMMGYASVFLLNKGFNNSTIGIVLSLVSIIAVFAQPTLASFADDHKPIPIKSLVCIAIAVVIGLSAILYLLPISGILLLVVVVAIFSIMNTIMPLMNSLAFVFENHGIEINYGLARGLGSVAYAIASLLLGNIVNMYDANLIPMFYIIFSVLMFIVVHFYVLPKTYQNVHVEVKKEDQQVETKQLPFFKFCGKYKKFILLLGGFVLVYFAHTIINNFFIQILKPIGGNEGDMGNAVFLAAMLELPTMAYFNKLSEKVNCGTLIKVSIILFSAKHIITYLATNMLMIYAAQILQMGAYALFIPASVYYVKKTMNVADMNKGQSLVTMSMTLSGIFANLAGGILLDSAGVNTVLLISAVLSVIGSVIVVMTTEKV